MSLRVPAGKVTALVGASGSGKSTIVGLVERFYDPIGGVVKLDGFAVKDINVNSLRSHISLVSQEPNLFATTVFANVAFCPEVQMRIGAVPTITLLRNATGLLTGQVLDSKKAILESRARRVDKKSVSTAKATAESLGFKVSLLSQDLVVDLEEKVVPGEYLFEISLKSDGVGHSCLPSLAAIRLLLLPSKF